MNQCNCECCRKAKERSEEVKVAMKAIWDGYLIPWSKDMSLSNIIKTVNEFNEYVATGILRRK